MLKCAVYVVCVCYFADNWSLCTFTCRYSTHLTWCNPSWYVVRLVVVALKVITTCFAYTASCLYVCGLLDHLCQIIVPFYRVCIVYAALFAQDTWPTFLTRVDSLWCWLSWHHKFPIVCLKTWIVYYFNACILVLYSSPLSPLPPPPHFPWFTPILSLVRPSFCGTEGLRTSLSPFMSPPFSVVYLAN